LLQQPQPEYDSIATQQIWFFNPRKGSAAPYCHICAMSPLPPIATEKAANTLVNEYLSG